MNSMKKSVIIVFFLLFLLACAGRKSAQTPQPTEFRSGTQGLYMQFVTNLPPPKVFDREPLNVMIQVENRGTAPVGTTGLDRVYLSGFDNNIITGIPIDGVDIPPMEGRGPYMPQGGIDTVSFMGRIQPLGARRIDKYQPTLLATACYHYETIASAQVCIDPNPYAPTSAAKVCTPSTVGTGSQGAPIAVTSVEVTPSPEKSRFKITISNVGGGDVFRAGARYLNSCSPYSGGLGFNEIDFLRVADVIISGVSIKESCKPLDRESHIRLTNGQGQLFCEFNAPPGQSAFLTPLEILLDYGYRQSIFRQVDIRPVS
jgi:hypothetical protein